MERVKPLYLSRTYGVPLPNKEDATQSWEPEVFLDKVARMKGRLLKHGEPDLDSVAKIVLSDWVRGRIPFFVPPPERPEELNRAEAKQLKGQSKVVDVKGNWKALEGEDKVPGVKQNLGSIMQKNTFLAEDVQPLEDDFEPGEDDDMVGENGEDEECEEDEEELSWNDVFEGVTKDVQDPDEMAGGNSTENRGEILFVIAPFSSLTSFR